MDLLTLTAACAGAGIVLQAKGDTLFAEPKDRLTDEIRGAIRDHKPALLALYGQSERAVEPSTPTDAILFNLGDESLACEFYRAGDELGHTIAFDVETELVDVKVPGIALASASDGDRHLIVHPDLLTDFLSRHRDRQFVFFNAAFDWPAIMRHLAERDLEHLVAAWWFVVESGRARDVMILDALVRLATRDLPELRMRNLGEVAKEWLSVEVNKQDPFRTRYGEILEASFDRVDEGFFTYAVKDAVITRRLFDRLQPMAETLTPDLLLPGAIDRWGPLTEGIQVRGAIALDAARRNGITIDRQRQRDVPTGYHNVMFSLAQKLDDMVPGDAGDLFGPTESITKRDKLGRRITTDTGLFQDDLEQVRKCLKHYAEGVENFPMTPKAGAIATSGKEWKLYADRLFVGDWVEYCRLKKLVSMSATLDVDRIHPRYEIMTRSGRSSATKPNLQQAPRDDNFRSIFTAREGCALIVIDFGAVEMRTFAQVLLKLYGQSKLAEVLQQGVDVHAAAGSQLLGLTLDEFDTHPERKRYRQAAKALNFGIPAGLGAKALVSYAADTYGVTLSLADAKAFRKKFIGEIYPEIGEYLKDNGKRPTSAPVYSLTGRRRMTERFTAACNFPFQSIAADGAKLALWRLTREGFPLAGFIHDEVIVEVPANADKLTEWFHQVDRILREEMAKVMPDIPVETEGAVTFRWSKLAELTQDEQGSIVPWVHPIDETFDFLREEDIDPDSSSPASEFSFRAEQTKQHRKKECQDAFLFHG